MKRQPKDWETIFANHISNKGLISKIKGWEKYNGKKKNKKRLKKKTKKKRKNTNQKKKKKKKRKRKKKKKKKKRTKENLTKKGSEETFF